MASSQVVVGDVDTALCLASALTSLVPQPGAGCTVERWEVLASVAAVDLTVARVLEAHLDAVAILAEAGLAEAGVADHPGMAEAAVADDAGLPGPLGSPAASAPGAAGSDGCEPGRTWGVFAAEAAGARLDATEGSGSWTLNGDKPWCSLAGRLSHALVTAHVPGGRRLFSVALAHPGVATDVSGWHARGLVDVPSGPVAFTEVPAVPVGPTGWYLVRPGFAYGGIGVAACWFGATVALARAMAHAARRGEADQLAAWHLGETDLDLTSARLALRDAAESVDRGLAHGDVGAVLALRVRSIVAAAAERTLSRAGHALGPAPLTLDDDHARRAADLTVYVRQHHAERDVSELGRRLKAMPVDCW